MDGTPAAVNDEGTQRQRGVLYPARLPTLTRVDPPAQVADLVRWFWIPEWDLGADRVSRQHLIAFPALNLVIEHGGLTPAGLVGLAGPTTRASSRDLAGRGWAVGALLRPAAVRTFIEDPRTIVDDYVALDLPELHARVTEAMNAPPPDEHRHSAAVAAFSTWLAEHVPDLSEEALLVNQLVDTIDLDQDVMRVGDVAERLGVSVRTVQRLARRYVGITPAAMIRRRRLQSAAERLRLDPTLDLTELAAELGYSDHAHLAREFRTTLGASPSGYRRDASDTMQ